MTKAPSGDDPDPQQPRSPAPAAFGIGQADNQLLLLALEHTADSVIISSNGGAILYANPAFEKLTGYRLEEVIGQPASILRAGKMSESFYEDMFRVLRSGEVFRATFISKTKSGQLYSEDKTVTPILDARGEVSHFVSIGRDATAAVDALEMEMNLKAAEEAEEFKSNLLGTISHELRTPLAAILSYTTAILDYGDSLGPERVTEYLHHIENRSRQLERLISDLLTMSRLESGNLPIQSERAQLQDEIAEIIGDWQLRGTLDLETSLPDEPQYVDIDVMRIREVLQNLLENAEKYAGTNRRVVISVQPFGTSQVEVTVRDHGAGVPQDEIDSIFDRFQRSRAGGNPSGGAGIGLSICRGIVEAHGGNIRAYLPEDGGLAVAFTIPLAH